MTEATYTNGNPENSAAIRQQARTDAEAEFAGPTAEEFANHVVEAVKDSEIVIVEEVVPVEFDDKRDEVYYSREQYPRIRSNEEEVWFRTTTDDDTVRRRIAAILREFSEELNGGILTKEQVGPDGEKANWSVRNPYATEAEYERKIQTRTDELERERREYRDVDESDVTGDCPRDGCDGKQYQDGMGSVGPRYRCTRKGCGYQFTRDVR